MKKITNIFIAICIVLLSQQVFAQSPDCSTAVQICNGIYPQPSATAGIGTSELDSGNDGCLSGENGSNWYYVQVTTGGTISFSAQGETSTGASADIDGAVWGPFTSVAAGCTAISGGSDPIRCSYAAAPYGITLQGTTNGTTESSTGDGIINAITGATVGQYYLIFLDNYNAGNSSAAVSVTLEFLSGNTAVYACPTPPTPCAPTCAAATASVCPKQDDGNIDALDGDVLPTNAFGTCYSYDVNPFKAGDTFTQCYQLNSGPSGTLGAVQQISIYGTDASLPDGPDCQGTVLASRTYTLVQSCGGANIPATLALGTFSSTFNPQWDNLTPNTNYVLCITTTVPNTPGITCNYRESCLDFYHPDRAGCSLVAAATTPVKEYCYGSTPGTIAADMGFSVTSFYAGPNATSSAGVGFAEICGDYNAALNTTAGNPTTNPSYTGFIVQSTYAYNPGTATGTDGESSGCDYITLVPITYISVNASGQPVLDATASNICTGTPIRIDFRPEITAVVGTYDCATGNVTIAPDGGAQDDGIGVTQADGTATVPGSYTVVLNGESQTIASGATGTFNSLNAAPNGTYTATITDSDGCVTTVAVSRSCVVGTCSSYSAPTIGTQACSAQQFNIDMPVLDCPGFFQFKIDWKAGSTAPYEIYWELISVQTGLPVPGVGTGGLTVSAAGDPRAKDATTNNIPSGAPVPPALANTLSTFTTAMLDIETYGQSYFIYVYDDDADGFNGTGGFIQLEDLAAPGVVVFRRQEGGGTYPDFTTASQSLGFTGTLQGANPVSVNWYVNGIIVETTSHQACADINHNYILSTANRCTPEAQTVGYSITCPSSGGAVVAQNLSIPVTVYPAPPTAASQLVSITVNELTCEPVINYLSDCSAEQVTVTATTPPTSGTLSGNAVFTVAYTGPSGGPDCCATGGPATPYVYNTPFTSGVDGHSPFFPTGVTESANMIFGPFPSALGAATASSFTINVNNYANPDATTACGNTDKSYWITFQITNGTTTTTVIDNQYPSGGGNPPTNNTVTVTNAMILAAGTSINQNSIIKVYVYANCGGTDYQGLASGNEWNADVSISPLSISFPNLVPTAADCVFENAITVPYSCPLCPTSTQPVATTQSICSGATANTAAANATITAGITDAGSTQLGGITWFTDAALTTVYSGGAITHSGANNCAKETVTLYAGIQCDKDGNALADDLDANATTDPDYIAAGTLPVDVYPTPVAGQNFTLPTAPCVTTISTACTGLTILYSATGLAGSFSASPLTITPGSPNLTVYYEVYITAAPAGCTKATGNYIVMCPTCPSSTQPTPTQSICSGATPTLPDATITAAITDPNTKQLGGIFWFTDATLTTAYTPAAIANTTCANTTLVLYAGIQCDKDGDNVGDDLDSTPATDPDYIAAGTFTVTINPAQPTASVTNNTTCGQPTVQLVSAGGANCGSATAFGTAASAVCGTGNTTVTSNGTFTAAQIATTFTATASCYADVPYSATSSCANTPNPAAPTVGTITQPTCSTATGSVALSGLPATGTWTVTASPGGATITGTGTTATFSGLIANTYTFTVTNSVSCTSAASTSATINAQPVTPAAPTVGTITQPTCSTATGSVALSGLPATGTWTVTASPGGATITGTGTTATFSGLAANTYTFTVTNADACTSAASTSAAINAPLSAPSVPIVGTITQPTCSTATGSVALSGLPSTGTWTVTASPGGATITGTGTTATFSGLTANTYTFTVTNADACTSAASASATINAQPVTPAAPIVGTITQPTCSTATGSVALSGLPSTGTWTVTASPGGATITGTGTTATFSGLAANTYTFTVTNADACTSATSTSATINVQPATPSITSAPTACTGSTYSITVNATVSSGTLEYSLDGGAYQTGNVFSGLANGSTHSVTVRTVGTTCTATTSGITAMCACATPPAVTITQATAATCGTNVVTLNYTVANGPATLTTTGTGVLSSTSLANGTSTFTYTPSAGEAGTTVTVTATIADPDGAGICASATDAVAITVNALPAAVAANGGVASCGGTISLTASPSGAASYAWSGPGGFTSNLQNPTRATATATMAGTYTVTITGTNGCVATANTIVTVGACSFVFRITDPCSCRNNATTLINGQFDEEVTLLGPAGFIVYAESITGLYQSSSTVAVNVPFSAPVNMPHNGLTGAQSGYVLQGVHVDNIGYTIAVSVYAPDGITLLFSGVISNKCAYPDPEFTVPAAPVCNGLTPISLSATHTDAGPDGTGVFSGAGVSGTTFVPSTAGLGTHNVTLTYTGGVAVAGTDRDGDGDVDADDNGVSPDGGTIPAYPGCIQPVVKTITVIDCCGSNPGTWQY